MIIAMYDGSRVACRKIEFSNVANKIIVDDCKTVPIIEILRIITEPSPPMTPFQKAMSDWVGKVLDTYDAVNDSGACGGVDTLRMIEEVDKIIADAFDHDTVL